MRLYWIQYYCAMTSSPTQMYEQRIVTFSLQIKQLQSKINTIAWTRFALIVTMIAAFWYIKPYSLLYAFAAALVCFAAFLRLVIISARHTAHLRNLTLLLQINQQELNILSGRYTDLPDGKEYLPATHDYAHDLDIFGRASMYQYINRTTSEQGNQTLSQWLLSPATVQDMLQRQEAAKALSPLFEWRQQLQAYGLAERITVSTEQKFAAWLDEENQFKPSKWNWIRFAGPAVIIGALLLYLGDYLSTTLFYLLVFIFFVITALISRKVSAIYTKLDKAVQQIRTLSSIIQWIEQLQVESDLLADIRQLCSGSSSQASTEINQLTGILNRLEYRLNPFVFLPLNIFLFWDLQQVLALEKWKGKNKQRVKNWFTAVQTMEALSTLATIHFNHPDWTFPIPDNRAGVLKAEKFGHPLIAESKRVCSSYSTEGVGRIALITGSNMAGKSTFLRSTGINIVLAMMGAPVCAKSFVLSPMRVISSMRITDNLEENTSTFYAELKKLRHIIEEVNKGENVYLLLDEILRGTNSLDRHIGSKALVQQLIRHQAVGMVATHDIELAALQNDYPSAISNYHFDVQVSNDELYFDYLLKNGICQSLNASILMKKIGIEF